MRHVKNSRGSALLVALIIMGILMTVAIGISELLIRSYRDNRQMIDRTGAWYQAEAGIESALLHITLNPPGFEAKEENIDKADDDDTSFFGYTIKAAARQVPERLYDTQPEPEQFNALPLSQTVTIPLFSGTNPDVGVKKMRIDYYLGPKIRDQGGKIRSEEFPILRWKIFGKAANGSIEVISDIAPEVTADTSCIGTIEDIGICPIQGGPYFQNMGNPDNPEIYINEKAFISTFLENHTQNFLILTNMVNINLIGGTLNDTDKKKLASVMYRVRQLDGSEGDNRISLPTARITADGFNRNTKQSIDLEIDRERSLPIFNYALYKP